MKIRIEIKLIFVVLAIFFLLFLCIPIARLFSNAFWTESGITLEFFKSVLNSKNFIATIFNSFKVSAVAAIFAVVISFIAAYSIHYTGIPRIIKKLLIVCFTLPMFIPTITYGFAIIYSFGKMGLITRILGTQLFDIYGFNGLLLGYVIFTVPVTFLLIHNTMNYIDKRTIIVSKNLYDNSLSTFWISVFRPLLGTLCCAFLQSFFLCFTDFGIPASVGGNYNVLAIELYNCMMGGVPDFNGGAMISIFMLMPSVLSVLLLSYVDKFNIRYDKISKITPCKNNVRDSFFSIFGVASPLCVLGIFAVIFVLPFTLNFPYQSSFTLEHFIAAFTDNSLQNIFLHSLAISVLTAFFGTLFAYIGALVTRRSNIQKPYKRFIDFLALATNTIPGMVLGVAFLFMFSGTSLQNTFVLIIICNIVHYFSTPYLMMRSALEKLNSKWETVACLKGDNWLRSIIRIVTPNARESLIETFSYYFVNSMVTISALIFITGAKTMTLTTKIKQLQYVNNYNHVFVLSIMIFATNLLAIFIFKKLKSTKKRSLK